MFLWSFLPTGPDCSRSSVWLSFNSQRPQNMQITRAAMLQRKETQSWESLMATGTNFCWQKQKTAIHSDPSQYLIHWRSWHMLMAMDPKFQGPEVPNIIILTTQFQLQLSALRLGASWDPTIMILMWSCLSMIISSVILRIETSCPQDSRRKRIHRWTLRSPTSWINFSSSLWEFVTEVLMPLTSYQTLKWKARTTKQEQRRQSWNRTIYDFQWQCLYRTEPYMHFGLPKLMSNVFKS